MNYPELLLLSVALAVDASVCSIIYGNRLRESSFRLRTGLILACSFGLFQFLMPVTGHHLSLAVYELISSFAPYLACALLCAVALSMVYEALHPSEEHPHRRLGLMTVLALAIATSLDALAVGFSLGLIGSGIMFEATVIGVVCFALSLGCFYLGVLASTLWHIEKALNLAGAAVLTGIGIEVLLGH